MVATQLLISLCLAGLAASAPQFSTFNTNQDAIVDEVVVALGPSISAAVAEALAGLNFNSGTTRVTTTTSNSGGSFGGSAGFAGGNSGFRSSTSRQSSTGFAAGGAGASSSSFGGSSSGTAVASGRTSAAAKEEEVTTRPEYNFKYQVADEEAQTYITKEESRDGDDTVGTYSYVDANGALVTVNYQAGVMGYTQTVEKQDGFVDVSKRPVPAVKKATSSASNSVGSSINRATTTTNTAFNSRPATTAINTNRQVTTTSSSSLDQSALIAQIVQALQPSISAAVNDATASRRTVTTRVQEQAVQQPQVNIVRNNAVGGTRTTTTTRTNAASGLDRNALIAQIISSLQPSISSAVDSAVSSQQGQTTVVRTVSSRQGTNPLFF